MNDPWAELGLEPGASDDAIRRQYLALVRKHSPDRDAEAFARIRAAYDALRDPVQRMKRQLFDIRPSVTMDQIIQQTDTRLRDKRIPTDLLLSLGRH